jgi:uncharacterized protein YkwD
MLLGRRCMPAVIALMVVVASASLPATAAAAPCQNAGTAGTLLDEPTFERAVVCLINRERAALKRRPLRPNPRLRWVASRYAARMVAEGFFAHKTPDGSSILSRLENAGYLEEATEWAIGENLSWAEGIQTTPAAIVQGWVDSPPHRENLLRPAFREIGVGVAAGTPEAPTDLTGLTVASEYGFRTGPRPESRQSKK